ncbi:MAG: hypothetical protein WAX69_17425 [Victivallales bacterium]
MKTLLTLILLLFAISSFARIGESYEQCKQRYGLDSTSKPYVDAVNNYNDNVKKFGQKQADEFVSRFKRELANRDQYDCYQRSFIKDNVRFNITFLKDVAVKITVGNAEGAFGKALSDDEIKAFMLANSKNTEWTELSKEKKDEIMPMIRKAGVDGPRGDTPLYSYDKYYAIKGKSCTIISNDLLNQIKTIDSKKSQDIKKTF